MLCLQFFKCLLLLFSALSTQCAIIYVIQLHLYPLHPLLHILILIPNSVSFSPITVARWLQKRRKIKIATNKARHNKNNNNKNKSEWEKISKNFQTKFMCFKKIAKIFLCWWLFLIFDPIFEFWLCFDLKFQIMNNDSRIKKS